MVSPPKLITQPAAVQAQQQPAVPLTREMLDSLLGRTYAICRSGPPGAALPDALIGLKETVTFNCY